MGLVIAVLVGIAYLVLGPRGQDNTAAPSHPPETNTSQAPSNTPVIPHEPAGSPSPLPSKTSSASNAIDLNGTTLQVPKGWQVYADDKVHNSRRLVRLQEATTDTRIQAVTLTDLEGSLEDACKRLVTDQQKGFTRVAESKVVDVDVSSGAEGAACSFEGIRSGEKAMTKVEFTILRRTSDKQSLIFRDTIPAKVNRASPVMQQLITIECGAAASFKVQVASCSAVTPGPGDG